MSLLGWLPGGLAIVAIIACAFFTAFTPPSSLARRTFRLSPSPAMSSSELFVIRLPRNSRWNVLAKRCASSRMRCSMNSASPPRGTFTGSGLPGTYTSSKRLASEAMGISSSSPKALTTRSATAS